MSSESFIHNKYGYPTTEENEEILKFTSRNNYNVDEELNQLILKYFGDVDALHEKGLRYHFVLLEKEVREKHLIGLVLYGANKNSNTVHINDYIDFNFTSVKITVQSVCYVLLEEYIKNDNIKVLITK